MDTASVSCRRKAKGWSVKRRKSAVQKLILHLLMILFVVAMAFPFLWMISSAFKTKEEVFRFPPSLIPDQLLWGNFAEAY